MARDPRYALGAKSDITYRVLYKSLDGGSYGKPRVQVGALCGAVLSLSTFNIIFTSWSIVSILNLFQV